MRAKTTTTTTNTATKTTPRGVDLARDFFRNMTAPLPLWKPRRGHHRWTSYHWAHVVNWALGDSGAIARFGEVTLEDSRGLVNVLEGIPFTYEDGPPRLDGTRYRCYLITSPLLREYYDVDGVEDDDDEVIEDIVSEDDDALRALLDGEAFDAGADDRPMCSSCGRCVCDGHWRHPSRQECNDARHMRDDGRS